MKRASLAAASLAPLLFLLSPTSVLAQENPPKPDTPAKARLTVTSDPDGATVLIIEDKGGKKPRLSDGAEKILGKTPLDTETPSGKAEVLVVKDGYILKVEPVELKAGAAQRLEVHLTKDIEVPEAIAFRGTKLPEGIPALSRTQSQSEQLIDLLVRKIATAFVEERDPVKLEDAASRALVLALESVREREALLRKELGDEARVRFYSEEVDLRAYPAIVLSEEDTGAAGRKRWTLASGSLAVEGVTDSSDLDTYRKKLHSIYAFVKNKWDTQGKLDDETLARALVEGVIATLDDQHTHFLAPSAYKSMDEETSGHFGGVGLQVATRDGHLTVIAPMEGTPAEKAGILSGDRIVAIDGHTTDGMVTQEAAKAMRGEPDTKVELTIRRGDQAPFKVNLMRAVITIKNTKSRLLETTLASGKSAKIGYLRITSFMNENLTKDVSKNLDDLESKGAQALVIDLRNNPGGLLTQALGILDMFVPAKEVVLSQRGRIESKVMKATDAPKRKKYPIAILVNEGSASASEILSGVLREHGLAVLVGEKTFGKGSVQRVIALDPFESAIALTIATYHFPSGVTPHKKGIVPDVVVKLEDEEKLRIASRSIYGTSDDVKDRQLDAALGELSKKLGE